MHVYEVLRRPMNTEKVRKQWGRGQYTFEVDRRANKLQVKQAVEKVFGVDVISVNIMNMPGKRRRFGRHVAHSPSWKKAVVTIAQGQRIEISEGV
jgi:large subunit ribosomal protein L23